APFLVRSLREKWGFSTERSRKAGDFDSNRRVPHFSCVLCARSGDFRQSGAERPGILIAIAGCPISRAFFAREVGIFDRAEPKGRGFNRNRRMPHFSCVLCTRSGDFRQSRKGG